MDIAYKCNGNQDMKPRQWIGHISLLRSQGICELEVTVRSSLYHIVCGRHKYGIYLCIPNWGIGTELSSLKDKFWNQERLISIYPEISLVDIISIVEALHAVNEYVSL